MDTSILLYDSIFLESKPMQFLPALFSLDPSHLTLLGMVLFVLVGAGAGAASCNSEEDDVSEYENASWNPSSVNYNE